MHVSQCALHGLLNETPLMMYTLVTFPASSFLKESHEVCPCSLEYPIISQDHTLPELCLLETG